ncbi:MAG: TOBE domain-containing protein [Candidatus Adiutrix sp.]|jgi:molybdate transport system regulatory protein|nr:TOBE domain-containing protein [Candidatus Adiutrix sp.]
MSGIKTSARNLFKGKVKQVTLGAVNAEVVLDIGGQDLVAIITIESAKSLGLAAGQPAYALIKASWVILTEGRGLKVSARNNLAGAVDKVIRGAVNTEVLVNLGGDRQLTAIITNASADNLALKEGTAVGALIKASHVIVAVDA